MNTPSGVSQPPPQSATAPSALARLLKTLAAVEPLEVRAVLLSMFYFLFLFGSYSVVKPVRDAMGTVYGVKHLQELFTATFVASLVFAPLYAGLASRIRLSTFLADIFSRTQAKRLFGFVAAGGTIGGIVGPLLAKLLSEKIGNNGLMV